MMQNMIDLDASKSHALMHLDRITRDSIQLLESMLEDYDDSAGQEEAAGIHKKLSGLWFANGYIELAGYHAERVAGIENTAEAWSIAGTTYSFCAQRARQEDLLRYCVMKARASIESAISMDPENVSYRINQSLLLVDHPDEGNPMMGITMLLQLAEQHHDDHRPLFHLGRLAYDTGQYERCVERMEKVISMEPNELRAYYYKGKALSMLNDTHSAKLVFDQALERNPEENLKRLIQQALFNL